MNHSEKTTIPLSKSKLILLSLGAVVFVALGFWLLSNPLKASPLLFASQTVTFCVGVACLLFFGIISGALFKKLKDKTPGLSITEEGIHDNASGISAGFIPWNDVLDITETKVAYKSFLNIVVRNPEQYLERPKNVLVKKLVQMNYRAYGTVITISSVALDCNFRQLKNSLNQSFEQYKTQKATLY